MHVVIIMLSILVVLATALPLLKSKHWLIRNFEFPRLQILICSLFALCLFIFLDQLNIWMMLLAGLLIVSSIYQAYKIFPYTTLAKKQTLESNAFHSVLTLITANVQKSNRQYEKCLSVLKSITSDILLLIEVDEKWINHLNDLYKDYPYHLALPLNNSYGMLLLSKYELVNSEIKFMVETDVPSIHTQVKLPDERLIQLFCVHPKPPAPPIIDESNEKSIERDAELIQIGKLAKLSPLPTIVIGDLNDVAWSDTTYQFQTHSGLLDPRRGRGLFNSFHAKYFFLRFPLDHIFHSPEFQFVHMKRLPTVGSDHFPILAQLSLP